MQSEMDLLLAPTTALLRRSPTAVMRAISFCLKAGGAKPRVTAASGLDSNNALVMMPYI